MSIFSDTFRTIIWFLLCVSMAVGMIIFAIIYGVVTYGLKKIAWKDFDLSFPNVKIIK